MKDGCAEDNGMMTATAAAAEPRVFRPQTKEPGTGRINDGRGCERRLGAATGCLRRPIVEMKGNEGGMW